MTSARDKAVEALARMLAEAEGYPKGDPAWQNWQDDATVAFDANHPALVWRYDYGDAIAGEYSVSPCIDSEGFTLSSSESGFVDHFPTPAAAQAAAEDHHIAQRLAGTKLWEQMEEMG